MSGHGAGPGDSHLRLEGFVTFLLENQWLGIPVVLVQEVLVEQRVSPVPLSPEEVAGFLNLRGQIVTAIELRARLGLAPRTDQAAMNVVVRDEDELYSLIVDEVGDVVQVGMDQVEATPQTLDPVWKQCSRGVIRLDEGLLLVLDVDRVLRKDAIRAA